MSMIIGSRGFLAIHHHLKESATEKELDFRQFGFATVAECELLNELVDRVDNSSVDLIKAFEERIAELSRCLRFTHVSPKRKR